MLQIKLIWSESSCLLRRHEPGTGEEEGHQGVKCIPIQSQPFSSFYLIFCFIPILFLAESFHSYPAEQSKLSALPKWSLAAWDIGVSQLSSSSVEFDQKIKRLWPGKGHFSVFVMLSRSEKKRTRWCFKPRNQFSLEPSQVFFRTF